MIPIQIRIPLRNICIDGDKQQAIIDIPDGDAFLQAVLTARANPEKAAVLPESSEDE